MKHNFAYILNIIGLLSLALMSLAAGDEWTKKADIPTPRWGLSTSVVDGLVRQRWKTMTPKRTPGRRKPTCQSPTICSPQV